MNQMGDIRSLFSRYELAAAGAVLYLTFAAAGVALLLVKGSTGGLVASWVLAALIGIVAYAISLCPICGKSPMRRARGEVAWALYLMAPGRLWPERQCSECGAALDEEPND